MAKEDLFKALKCEEVTRAAWLPFSGVHSGSLLGYSAEEVLKDADKLFMSLMEANRLYQADGLPVIFDLQVEAEILGCDLFWAVDSPPTVVAHVLSAEKVVPDISRLPTEKSGRLPIILDVMRKAKVAIGETTALYGLICGPFTLASHLRGSNIFLDMYDDPEYVKQLLVFCRKVAEKMTQLYLEAGMDVIAYVDPLVSQISEKHFSEFLTEHYRILFADLKKKRVFSSFFVCGDATRNLEVMCQSGPDNISIDENIDIVKAKAICEHYGVSIGGNIQLTVTMLHGSQQSNMKAVIDIIESCGVKGLVVAPGCDLPYATPPENIIAASQAVLNFTEVKKMVADYEETFDLADQEIEIPDYSKLKQPLVEIFSLDSANCAACGYMLKTVTDLHQTQALEFDFIEHKSTEKENILRCKKIGVQKLPSLYINGELQWSSLIPSSKELLVAIEKAKQ